MIDYSDCSSEMLLIKKLNIIDGAFNNLKKSITKFLDNGSFNTYKEEILPQMDSINSDLQNLYMGKSIYDLVENCHRDIISNYISSSNTASINNCIGQIEIQAAEYCSS